MRVSNSNGVNSNALLSSSSISFELTVSNSNGVNSNTELKKIAKKKRWFQTPTE